jgi:hypothetical protein
MSAMPLIYSPATLAGVLREWLLNHPEKVLFGTDASAFGPDTGWELTAWMGTTHARQALAIALTGLVDVVLDEQHAADRGRVGEAGRRKSRR